MSHNDMPPLYSHHSAHPVPTYTELAHRTERVLHRSLSESNSAIVASHLDTREHKYRTDSVEINLGPCPWGLLYAAYGRCGSVKGLVTFMKDCSSILEVTTTLQGIVKITMSERTMVAGVAKKTYMSEKATLFKSESATSLQAGTTYPFLLTFPEHVIGSDTPLPPSSSLFQPHASAEISYTLQVDIVRGAFRRHEMRTIPILHLPKCSPRFPPLTDMPLMLPGLVLPEGMRRVDVSAVWPASGPTQRTDKDLAVVQLYVPEPSVFASGETIHLALSISCPHSPAIPKLLSDSIGIFLVKRRKVWINEGRQISVREVVVEKVTELHVNSMLEGTMYLTAELTGGQHGTECSWGILGYAAIEYIIRVIVRPPTYANHLPTFKHDEVVQMCTDSYGTLERELLIMDGTPMPALGLTNVVAPPRSPHHISDIPSSH